MAKVVVNGRPQSGEVISVIPHSSGKYCVKYEDSTIEWVDPIDVIFVSDLDQSKIIENQKIEESKPICKCPDHNNGAHRYGDNDEWKCSNCGDVIISKKDYDEFALLWNVFQFMTSPTIGIGATEIFSFIKAYGMNSRAAKFVAKNEEVDFGDYEGIV